MAGSVQDLMNAIAQMEGFNVSGSIAQRNNNPGNLRYAPNQVGQENTVNGKYATFASVQDGWDALQNYIQANQGLTLRDFIYKYAPPTENNTTNYLNWLVSQVGVAADSLVGSLFGNGSPSGNDSSYSNSSGDIGTSNASTDGLGIDMTTTAIVVVGAALVVGLVVKGI